MYNFQLLGAHLVTKWPTEAECVCGCSGILFEAENVAVAMVAETGKHPPPPPRRQSMVVVAGLAGTSVSILPLEAAVDGSCHQMTQLKSTHSLQSHPPDCLIYQPLPSDATSQPATTHHHHSQLLVFNMFIPYSDLH